MKNSVSISGSISISSSENVNFANIHESKQYYLSEIDDLEKILVEAKRLSSSGELETQKQVLLDQSIYKIENSDFKQTDTHPLSKKIVQESLKTIRNIAEGITGSILASQLVNLISKII